jgi:hypothetical protein
LSFNLDEMERREVVYGLSRESFSRLYMYSLYSGDDGYDSFESEAEKPFG